jgi:SPP1 family predicted phage head-tail adaptor
MKKTGAGRFDRQITIKERTIVKKPSGQEHFSYGPVAVNPVVPAQKEDRSSIQNREGTEANQITAKGYTVFTIRYRDDLKRTMSIECEGVEYNIQSINEIGRRKGLQIFTEQKEQ